MAATKLGTTHLDGTGDTDLTAGEADLLELAFKLVEFEFDVKILPGAGELDLLRTGPFSFSSFGVIRFSLGSKTIRFELEEGSNGGAWRVGEAGWITNPGRVGEE
jgi:hypothetical protein